MLTPAALHRAPRRLLNEILSCDSWESLQTRVRTAAVEGELSDKTLSALQQVMQQAVGRGEQEDPRVVSSLEQAGRYRDKGHDRKQEKTYNQQIPNTSRPKREHQTI